MVERHGGGAVLDISRRDEQVVREGTGDSVLLGRKGGHKIVAVIIILWTIGIYRPEVSGTRGHRSGKTGTGGGFGVVGHEDLSAICRGPPDDGDLVAGRPEYFAVRLPDGAGFVIGTGESGGQDGDFTVFFRLDVRDIHRVHGAGERQKGSSGCQRKGILFHGGSSFIHPGRWDRHTCPPARRSGRRRRHSAGR